MDDPLPSRAIPPPRLMASLCSSRAFCTFSSASSRRCIPTSDDLREARMDGTWKMAIENGYMMGYYVCTMVYIIIYILWGMYIHIYIDIMGCVYTYIYIYIMGCVYIYIWNTYYYIPYNIYIYTGYIPYIWLRHTLWRNWTYPPKKKTEVDRKKASKWITSIELPRLITRGSARLGCLDVSISGMGTPSYGHETNRRRPKIEGWGVPTEPARQRLRVHGVLRCSKNLWLHFEDIQIWDYFRLPSGNLTVCYWKWP